MTTLEILLLTVVLIMLMRDLIMAVVNGRVGADLLVNERLERLMSDRESMALIEKAYKEASGVQRQVIGVLADVVKFIAPLTPIIADDTASRLLDDLITPDGPIGGGHEPEPETPEEPETPGGVGETITVNPLLENALDGTVDTGTDFRYQKRPLGWLVYWKRHMDHDTPPFINAVAGGFKAELAYIAGKVGYVSEMVHHLEPGYYLLKMVVDANVTNTPPNSTDVAMRGALLRADGVVFKELPGQGFGRWVGENTYLMPVQVAAEGIDVKVAVYVDLVYPTLGAESSVTFKEIRLLRDDGQGGHYVVV